MKRGIIITAAVALLGTLTGCYYFGPCIDGSGPVRSEIREITGFSGVNNTGSFNVYVNRSDEYRVEVKAQENLIPIIETYLSGHTLIVQTKDGTCFRSDSPVEVYVSLPELEELTLSASGKLIAESAHTSMLECVNSGSGHLVIDTVVAHDFTAGNSGSGTITIGEVTSTEVGYYQSGSGTIDGGTLFSSTELKIRHSSSGRIRTTLIDGTLVDVVLSGSGKIDLFGVAATAKYTLNASGKIDALELMAEDVEATNTGSGNIYVYATDFLDAEITASGNIIYRGDPVVNYRITGSGSLRRY
jgi:hypothetical protein